ncbi:MAG TPA: aminotransferase class V-fold PLP-dependent enzyme [Gemmatimonadaceae bacterium]|nr:aminotransferase class V-fold PLP-dependent enzyme [Gemmatimonadaceae bacterium]
MSFGTFFVPGPTEVRREVLNAMTRPVIAHRGRAFEELAEHLQAGLRAAFGTQRPVLIGTCSATGFMEMGVRCARPGPVLSLVNGAFSGRYAKIAAACGREVDRYDVEWGTVHDVAELGERLSKRDYAAMTVVHSETSTGALNDVRALCAVARARGVACLVDSVSGIGGAEFRFDAWEFDYALTGSQKALAVPPGLAFAVASERFLAEAPKARDRGVYFDLVEFAEFAKKNQMPNTPAVSLMFALEKQLADIGPDGFGARWARHRAMAERTHAWVDETRASLGVDVRVLAATGHRSPTVTAVALPSGMSGSRVVDAVAERGFTIGNGYAKLKESTIRIGHMGDHTLATLNPCLDACAAALRA